MIFSRCIQKCIYRIDTKLKKAPQINGAEVPCICIDFASSDKNPAKLFESNNIKPSIP